jgi:hypothetical protein
MGQYVCYYTLYSTIQEQSSREERSLRAEGEEEERRRNERKEEGAKEVARAVCGVGSSQASTTASVLADSCGSCV